MNECEKVPCASHGDRDFVNSSSVIKPDKCFGAKPMFFNNARVASFLKEHGYVYTVRQKIKRPLPEKRIAVKGTYIKKEQLGYFVKIYLESEKVGFDVLTKYVSESGFDKIEDWVMVIIQFNKRKGLRNTALYKVVME